MKNTQWHIDAVQRYVNAYVANVELKVDARDGGRTFVDATRDGRHAVVEWVTDDKGRVADWGYGVSLVTNDTGYGEKPDSAFPYPWLAAREVQRLLADPKYLQVEALMAAKEAIEGVSQATDPADPRVTHCFHCDEFMDEAEWPNHANPQCPVAPALKLLDQALEALGAKSST